MKTKLNVSRFGFYVSQFLLPWSGNNAFVVIRALRARHEDIWRAYMEETIVYIIMASAVSKRKNYTVTFYSFSIFRGMKSP